MNDSGTTLLTTEQRISSLLSSSHQAFPPIPSSAQDFLSTGVNQRPAFFGCNPSQIPAEYPLIIYIPNSPPLDGSPPASKYVSILSSYLFTHTTRYQVPETFNSPILLFPPPYPSTRLSKTPSAASNPTPPLPTQTGENVCNVPRSTAPGSCSHRRHPARTCARSVSHSTAMTRAIRRARAHFRAGTTFTRIRTSVG